MKLLSIALLLSLTCFAQERHIDFTQVLLNVYGKPILQAPDAQGKQPPLTLGDAAIQAFGAVLESDKSAPRGEKFKNDQLAHKIYNQKNIHLTVEEIALIKTRIDEAFGSIVVGPAWRLLDPEAKKAEAKPEAGTKQ